MDSSLLTLRIDSASKRAMESCLILAQFEASLLSGMVSVTTKESMLEFSMLLIAGPDSTGCVQ